VIAIRVGSVDPDGVSAGTGLQNGDLIIFKGHSLRGPNNPYASDVE